MGFLKKPEALNRGDKIAAVSLSWGGAGDPDILWRYELGKRRLDEIFGLELIEMPNTLKGSRYLYGNPKKRAEDLMEAFSDKSVKGIFSCIGGEESIRMLPYIDFDIIKNNPKVFLGYSDSTITHFMCLKAGLTSFYGPSVLAEFSENLKMYEYTENWFRRAVFNTEPIGLIPPSEEWTAEHIKWSIENKSISKKMQRNTGIEVLQGKGIIRGNLIGGCIDVLEMMKETPLWPSAEIFNGAILFFETSEDTPEPSLFRYWLRSYCSMGIMQRVNGIVFGKPYQEKYYEEYKNAIRTVIAFEEGLLNLPILYNMSFGHNEPMFTIPYGTTAEINTEEKTFAILESGVC